MRLDLEWDDCAYLLAVLHRDSSRRASRIRRELVGSMREYDADSPPSYRRITRTQSIRRRVAHWLARLESA